MSNVDNNTDTSGSKDISSIVSVTLALLSIIGLAASIVALVTATIRSHNTTAYVGCVNPTDNTVHVYQSSGKPVVSGSTVHIGDRVFITPFPGGACKIYSEEEFHKKQQELVDLPVKLK